MKRNRRSRNGENSSTRKNLKRGKNIKRPHTHKAITTITSPITFSPDDYKANPVPNGLVALMGRRACSDFYNHIVRRFNESAITRTELARRSGKTTAQISRWLASPHNWTVETAGIILFAINGRSFSIDDRNLFQRSPTNYDPLRDNQSFAPTRSLQMQIAAAE